MTAFKLQLREPEGQHQRCAVFVGPDAAHLAHVGVLTFRTDEAETFVELVRAGCFEFDRNAREDGEPGSGVTVIVDRPAMKVPQAPAHEPEF